MEKPKENKRPVKVKRWFVFFLLLFIYLIWALGVPALHWTKGNVKNMRTRYNSILSPVIMIPGSSATQNRFDDLVHILNSKGNKKHSLLKVKVYNNGRITYDGKIHPGDNEPIIVVGFQNNKDGYSNIKKQAYFFHLAFNQLSDKYKFNNFKAIGHSNGGLIYTRFFEKYFDDDEVTCKKLMTIATPYNFSESSISHKTQMLADMIKDRQKIPEDMTVYSVAGTESYESDGRVPEGSVRADKYIYQNQVQHFTEITVTGSDAQHSDLPQNKQIVQMIQQYILDFNHGFRSPQQQGSGSNGGSNSSRQDSENAKEASNANVLLTGDDGSQH